MALRIDESQGLWNKFRGGGKIKLDIFFPTRKAVDERWEVVMVLEEPLTPPAAWI